MIKQEVLDYLETQRVGVLAVEMPDGSPHAATVHYAHANSPFELFFETNRRSKKAEAILSKDVTRASLVVGVSEEAMKTLQMDGTLSPLLPQDKDLFNKAYVGKFEEKKSKLTNPDIIAIKFTPHWWRFTDFTNSQRMIITSEE